MLDIHGQMSEDEEGEGNQTPILVYKRDRSHHKRDVKIGMSLEAKRLQSKSTGKIQLSSKPRTPFKDMSNMRPKISPCIHLKTIPDQRQSIETPHFKPQPQQFFSYQSNDHHFKSPNSKAFTSNPAHRNQNQNEAEGAMKFRKIPINNNDNYNAHNMVKQHQNMVYSRPQMSQREDRGENMNCQRKEVKGERQQVNFNAK